MIGWWWVLAAIAAVSWAEWRAGRRHAAWTEETEKLRAQLGTLEANVARLARIIEKSDYLETKKMSPTEIRDVGKR